jgi:hypothetical protein
LYFVGLGFLFVCLFVFAGLGFELRAFNLIHSTTPIFVMCFFEIGSQKLFVWYGFEPSNVVEVLCIHVRK